MIRSKLLGAAEWADGRRASPATLIAVTTFGILALELALIRWTSSQVRVFAYFNNLVLIGAFLGMGLGVALGRRHPGLVHGTLPLLLLIGVPLAFSSELGLVHLTFPDHTVSLWGAGYINANAAVYLRNLATFLALFTAIVAVFVCAGAPLGQLFSRLPVLRAYTADLLGSLLGIAAFALVSWREAGPAIWLALGALPFAWLARTWLAAGSAAAIIVLAQGSARDALFSPYNRIEVQSTEVGLSLEVNRDFHQYLHDLSDRRLADPLTPRKWRGPLAELRAFYDFPFTVNSRRGSAVVVGAGTGNDVQAALRHGYAAVTSVDIDARIIAIGRALHPEHPYADPRVKTIVDDARAFFGRSRGEAYDLVCFGLLDSHAMSSAMSTLRLDNYVYTEEGIHAAWQRVGPGGHLSLAISSVAGKWFFERLYWTITRATGREPLAFFTPLHGATVIFLVPRDGVVLDAKTLAEHQPISPVMPLERTLTTSDDWPFLYVRPGVFPWGYLIVLTFVLGLAAAAVPWAFGLREVRGNFDAPLFLMGAAFLLIETRGVTSMSLLFGSTWVVNAAIFGGIVLMVLLANMAVQRWTPRSPLPWFALLFAAVVLLYLLPIAWLQSLPFGARVFCAGAITGFPVGCAGMIVPMLLARARQPASALGSNLLGAVLGGCLEYYSMLGGLRSTALMALALYLAAFLLLRRRATAVVPGLAVPVASN